MNGFVECPKCQKQVAVSDLNVGVVNEVNVSFLHCAHEHGVECAACGQYLKPAIVALPPGIFGWVPAEKPKDTPRVITSGLHLASH